MKRTLPMLFTASVMAAGLTAGAETVKFADVLSSWKVARLSAEKNGDYVRVQTVAKASGNYGQVYKLVPASPAGKYVQISVDNMENAQSFAWACTPTKSVRRDFGVIFKGINTYEPRINSSYVFSICQQGLRDKTGAWINYESITFSNAPENSLIAVKEPAAGALKVGDTINFKIFRQNKCAAPVAIRFFTGEKRAHNLQNFKLCKDMTVNAVYDEAAKCYTASVKVTEDAYSLDTVKSKLYLVAAADLDGLNSYFTMPFEANLETTNKIPTALFKADSPETRDNRQQWYDMVLGKKNLALKKPLSYTPNPKYRITQDIPKSPYKDATDLTDGYLTTGNSDKIWFDRRAVGFFMDGKDLSNTVYMRLDIGSVQPVDYIALRALGGAAAGFRFPRKFEVFVSKDGKKFYQTAEMTKVEPAEAYQSDFVKTYYYPEDRRWQDSYCKSFKLQVKADARYVVVKLSLDTHFFSDEMAVIAADKKGDDFNRAYDSKGIEIPADGLTAQPRVPELAIIKGIAAPQTFIISDFRPQRAKINKAFIILELPEQLNIFKFTPEKITVDGKKYHRFRLPIRKDMKFDPIYILSNNDLADQLPDFNIYVEYDGKVGFKQTMPIKVVTLPEFKTFKKLPVCLSWMVTESMFKSYPDLLKNYGRFGFNGTAVFPRYWGRKTKGDMSYEIARTEDMRKAGFKVFMNDSPVHVMANAQKTGSEVFCITKKGDRLICPSYTGVHYEKEMERLANSTKLSKPDHILLDIECFGQAYRRSAVECTRCIEAIKKSGKSAEEYMYSCGKRIMEDIAKALEKGAKEANIPTPALHMYDLDRQDNVHGITRFTDVYPQLVKSAQPGLYIGGHPAVIQKNVRNNYKLIGKRDVMPWLSTGCYGEYDSYLVEPIVLEALMNGAGGILNYAFGYFTDSPLDFYYHAQAIMKLAPYEELLAQGEYPDCKGTNDKMFYSMVKNGNEMLLLVGNYYKAAPATCVTLPYGKAEVLDLNTQKSFSTGKDFKFNVEPGKFSLFYIKQK